MITLARLLSYLPLSALHTLGRVLGWIPFLWSSRYRSRMRANLAQAGYRDPAMTRAVVREIGCGAMELAFIWMRPLEESFRYVVQVAGADIVQQAHDAGAGIVFLTPHLGCFELASLYMGAKMPLTVLYRPPRLRWLEPLMQRGRLRGFVKTASTDLSGVRKLMRALKSGEAVGLLPDQVPGEGAGQWADFFGRPAYTSSLAVRLAEATGARVVMAFCERLPRSAGYILRFHEVSITTDGESPVRQINREVERLVAQRPVQYLWSYNRYKVPAGVAPPAMAAATAEPTGAVADSRKQP